MVMDFKGTRDEDVLMDGLEMEQEAAEEKEAKEPEEVKEKGIFKLKKPLMTPDGELWKIPYDFGTVEPVTYINVVRAISKKESIAVPELNTNVQFTMFCKAAKMPVAVMRKVKDISDFVGMCSIARDFLLAKSGEDEEEHL